MPFTPIFIPMPVHSGPSFEERLNEAALKYSDKQELQSAFKAGARWLHVCDDVPWWAFILIMWAIFQGAAFIFGTLESNEHALDPPWKWKVVFPGFVIGQTFGRWMRK